MGAAWFRPRSYRHLDSPVGARYAARVINPKLIERHSWSPLISYVKKEKRYKPTLRKTIIKPRTLMYASHRDACILSFYAAKLTNILDQRYAANGLDQAVIAYRALGKSNYNFTAAALEFAKRYAPCVVLCFDVTGFFDNLDHKLLKRQLIGALGGSNLTEDWYAVLRSVTKFRHISLDTLKADSKFAERIKSRSRQPIATVAEVKAAGIKIEENQGFGIPQGTPISAVLSNLYMWDLDMTMVAASNEHVAFYQRYSDDILLVCSLDAEQALTKHLLEALAALKLKIKPEKTERAIFDPASPQVFQYLGFNVAPDGAVIRPGSLARQWRKARRSIRQTVKVGQAAIDSGQATKIYTKKLRRRFLPVGVRNFSSYARRAATALNSKKIIRQVRRLERMVDTALKET